MPARTLELEYPVSGIDRRLGLSKQKPFTTSYETNMRSNDSDEGRRRGGKRPGLTRAFAELLDSGSPIWALGQVREVTTLGGGAKFWEDHFDLFPLIDRLSAEPWTAASWRTSVPAVTSDGFAAAERGQSNSGIDRNKTGVVRTAFSDFDADKDYEVSMMMIPNNGTGGTYQIYIRLDDTTPNVETNGILVEIHTPRATAFPVYTVKLISSVAGVVTTYVATTSESIDGQEPGILKVKSASTNVITVSWRGTVLDPLTQTITTKVGKRIGFGIGTNSTDVTTSPTTLYKVDWFRIQYEPIGGAAINRNRVVALTRTSISASKGYRENNDSTLNLIGTGTVQDFEEGVVQMTEFLGRLYWTTTGPTAGVVEEYNPETDTIAAIVPEMPGGSVVPIKCPAIGTFQDRLVLSGEMKILTFGLCPALAMRRIGTTGRHRRMLVGR